MIGPDLRSSAFQVLSALTVPENRSAQGNMAPAADLSRTSGHRPLQPQAFHNQRPQAIAATGFPQPARAPRRAADRMDPAAMPRSSKAVRKAVTYRDHRRPRPRPHPMPFSLKTATGPATIVSRRPHGHRPSSRWPQARRRKRSSYRPLRVHLLLRDLQRSYLGRGWLDQEC